MKSNRFRFVLGLLIGVALLFAVTRFINLASTLERFDDYPWSKLWIALVLSLGYYLLKALRWHYFLRVIDIRLPLRRSVLVYLAGQWFAFTPAGEFVRAYLMTGYGFSFSRGSAAVAVQVLFDFLSLALVGSFSVLRYRDMATMVLPFTAILMAGILAFAYSPLIGWERRFSFAAGAGRLLGAPWRSFYQYSLLLLGWRSLLIGLALGLPAVVVAAAVLEEISRGYQISVSLSQSAYIYSLSHLAGGLSMLPHGLGAIEGSAVALFHYAGIDTADAATAIVLFRLSTVGLGIILGAGSLLLLRTPFAGPVPPRDSPE